MRTDPIQSGIRHPNSLRSTLNALANRVKSHWKKGRSRVRETSQIQGQDPEHKTLNPMGAFVQADYETSMPAGHGESALSDGQLKTAEDQGNRTQKQSNRASRIAKRLLTSLQSLLGFSQTADTIQELQSSMNHKADPNQITPELLHGPLDETFSATTASAPPAPEHERSVGHLEANWHEEFKQEFEKTTQLQEEDELSADSFLEEGQGAQAAAVQTVAQEDWLNDETLTPEFDFITFGELKVKNPKEETKDKQSYYKKQRQSWRNKIRRSLENRRQRVNRYHNKFKGEPLFMYNPGSRVYGDKIPNQVNPQDRPITTTSRAQHFAANPAQSYAIARFKQVSQTILNISATVKTILEIADTLTIISSNISEDVQLLRETSAQVIEEMVASLNSEGLKPSNLEKWAHKKAVELELAQRFEKDPALLKALGNTKGKNKKFLHQILSVSQLATRIQTNKQKSNFLVQEADKRFQGVTPEALDAIEEAFKEHTPFLNPQIQSKMTEEMKNARKEILALRKVVQQLSKQVQSTDGDFYGASLGVASHFGELLASLPRDTQDAFFQD